MGVHLTRRAPHGRAPYRRISHRRASHRRAPHGRAPYGRASYRRLWELRPMEKMDRDVSGGPFRGLIGARPNWAAY
jgi:hypothetical protein